MQNTKTEEKAPGIAFDLPGIDATVEMETDHAGPVMKVPEAEIRPTIYSLVARRPNLSPEDYVRAIQEMLANIQKLAIMGTYPQDWTLYKDRDGKIVGVVRDSGCVNVRKLYGISIVNHRPNDGRYFEPSVHEEDEPIVVDGKDTGKKRKVRVVEMWCDATCALTGEEVRDVYFATRQYEGGRQNFIGRGHVQDHKASCRTGGDSKAVRILTGLRKVPAELLIECGIDLEKCYHGSGWGSSQTRSAQRVAGEDVGAAAQAFWAELLSLVNGDDAAAHDLLKDVTIYDRKNGGQGWCKDVGQFTAVWQIEKARGRLKQHPDFGRDAVEAEEKGPEKGSKKGK